MSSDKIFDVAIVGGNFAGLALALGLAQTQGPEARLAVVDPKPPAGSDSSSDVGDGRAFAIWAGAQAVLESLGVWRDFETVAEPVTAIEISDTALTDAIRPTRVTYEALTPLGKPAAHIVPANDLHRALLNAVRNTPPITWIMGEAAHLVAGEHAADIQLQNGEIVSARLCVAADGRNSRLRKLAGIATAGHAYPQTGLIATVRFSKPHGGVAIQHFLPGGPFAILPLRNDRACITWSAASAEAERLKALDDDAFLAELDTRIGGRFGDITLDGPRQSWPLDIRLPRQLTARRLALLGDAAHGVHPIAGQGVNLALRDVAALIEVLGDAARLGLDLGNGAHLDRYQRWRRFDSTMSAVLYDGLNRSFSIDSMVVRAARGAALGVLDQLPSIKQMIIAEAAGVTGELPISVRERVG